MALRKRRAYSDFEFDSSSVDVFAVKLVLCLAQRFAVGEADFAAVLSHALMGVGVSHLARLAEEVFQVCPAKTEIRIHGHTRTRIGIPDTDRKRIDSTHTWNSHG